MWPGQKIFCREPSDDRTDAGNPQAALQLAPVRNTKLIAITVYMRRQNEAAQIANAIAESTGLPRQLARENCWQMELMCCSSNTSSSSANSERSIRFGITAPAIKNRGRCAASQSPQEQLIGTRTQLSQLIMLHELLNSKIEAVKWTRNFQRMQQFKSLIELNRTCASKANKTLNIFLGAVAGGFWAGGRSHLPRWPRQVWTA